MKYLKNLAFTAAIFNLEENKSEKIVICTKSTSTFSQYNN